MPRANQCVIAATVLVILAAADNALRAAEPSAIQGDWVVEAAEMGGKPVGDRVVIEGNRFLVKPKSGGVEPAVARCDLNAVSFRC